MRIDYRDGYYEGEVNTWSDIPWGEGTRYWNNGDYCSGKWENGKLHCEDGRFYWADTREEYFGDFVQGKMTGYGIYKWPDGDE